LLEILVTVAVLALLLGAAALRQGSEQSRASSEAIALELVAELNAARAKALATRRPVAICWPSGGKLTCQSFYTMEGLSKGRVTRSRDFSGDFQDGHIAVGYWSTATIAPSGDGATEVNPATWLPADFPDHALIFDPQGRVATNDLPLQDGSYQVVACTAVSATVVTPSVKGVMPKPPSHFKFSRIAGAHTISVRPNGTISLTQGAPGLTVDAHPFPMDPPAPAVAVAPPSFAPPSIDTVTLRTAPVLATVGTVTRDGTLTIEVTGSDPSGDDLYVQWKAEKQSGKASDNGYFSPAGRAPMDWNPKLSRWESTVTWAPPDDAAVGDTFDLTFEMSNSAGSKDSTGLYAELSGVSVVDDDLLFATGALGVYKMHKNGSGLELVIPSDKSPNAVNVSPDGSRVLWQQSAWDRKAIWVANIDGSGVVELSNLFPSMDYPNPVWNETGTTVFVAGSTSGKGGILCIRPDGTGFGEVLPRVPGHSYTFAPDISKDGRYIAAAVNTYRTPGDYSKTSRDLWVGKLNQSTYPPKVDYWTNVSLATGKTMGNTNTFLTFQEVSPDPDKPILVARAPWDAAWVVELTDTGSGFTAVFNVLNDDKGKAIPDYDITFSPDGTEAVSAGSQGLYLWDWSTTTGVPRLVNRRELIPAKPWLTSVDWR
jgi:hypothetical protein